MAAFVVWMQRSGQLPPETPVVLSQVAFRVLIPCFLMTKVCTPFQHYLLYIFDNNYVYLIYRSRVKYSYWLFTHMVWRNQCFGLLGSVSLSTNLTLRLFLKFKVVFVLNVSVIFLQVAVTLALHPSASLLFLPLLAIAQVRVIVSHWFVLP